MCVHRSLQLDAGYRCPTARARGCWRSVGVSVAAAECLHGQFAGTRECGMAVDSTSWMHRQRHPDVVRHATAAKYGQRTATKAPEAPLPRGMYIMTFVCMCVDHGVSRVSRGHTRGAWAREAQHRPEARQQQHDRIGSDCCQGCARRTGRSGEQRAGKGRRERTFAASAAAARPSPAAGPGA